MFTKLWRRAANFQPSFAQLVGSAKLCELPCLGMRDLDEERSGAKLLLGGELWHGEHRRKANALFLSGAPQVLDFPLLHPLFEVRFQDIPVFCAHEWVFKNFPACPFWVAHQVD